jgi:hypothetical protein
LRQHRARNLTCADDLLANPPLDGDRYPGRAAQQPVDDLQPAFDPVAGTLARKHLSGAPLGATPRERLRKTHIDGLIVALRRAGLSDSTVRQV